MPELVPSLVLSTSVPVPFVVMSASVFRIPTRTSPVADKFPSTATPVEPVVTRAALSKFNTTAPFSVAVIMVSVPAAFLMLSASVWMFNAPVPESTMKLLEPS